MAHPERVIQACERRFGPEYRLESKTLVAMDPPEGFMETYRFKSPPWFDVWNITNGLEVGGGGTFLPQIWIDIDRGVFYYLLTD